VKRDSRCKWVLRKWDSNDPTTDFGQPSDSK